VVVKKSMVGEDWQLSFSCLTRCFAVLVERRVVNEIQYNCSDFTRVKLW